MAVAGIITRKSDLVGRHMKTSFPIFLRTLPRH